MRFAAIDLGGSFIKSALVSAETLEHVHRTPFPGFIEGLDPSFREVSLPAIAAAFDEHVSRLLPHRPEALFISTQMHGFVLGDRYVSWQDQRADFDAFKSRVEDPVRIGNEMGPGHAATVLFWSAAAGAAALTRAGNAVAERAAALPPHSRAPLPLPNALIGSPTADETLAASFGVYDLHRRAWDQPLIENLGLQEIEWPRVTRWNEVVGEYRGLPVYSPIGDQQAALLGADLQPGELSLNIGTGSQVSVLSDTVRSGPFKLRPYIGDRFLATITHIPAGRALNILQRTVNRPWTEIDAEVETLHETDLAVDLSFYPSTFGHRGRIENIREGNLTAGHLFLAAYENMAANYAMAARRLFPNGDWGPLVLSGGLSHRAARLRALIAQRLERDYRLSPSQEETLTGLARLACKITGSK